METRPENPAGDPIDLDRLEREAANRVLRCDQTAIAVAILFLGIQIKRLSLALTQKGQGPDGNP